MTTLNLQKIVSSEQPGFSPDGESEGPGRKGGMTLRPDHRKTEKLDGFFIGGSKPVPDASRVPNGDPPAGFRRLHQKEVVTQGDFVMNDLQEVEPWDGPGGFRADSFVKQIYRRISAAPQTSGDHDE